MYVIFGTSSFWSVLAIRRICNASTNRSSQDEGQACHTFRATDITAYLKNGGKLEIAQQMAAHESTRTTRLYDRRNGEISLDEVEGIVI